MKREPDYKPLVSIITPSFNQGKYIEETIKSVLAQDYDNIEYIVVDGGSTDNTLDILNKYKDKLTFISEPDKGQSHAINKGFKMAKGEILAWLNSDDMYIEGAVSKAVGYLIKHPDVAMVYGEGYMIDEQSANLGRFPATQDFSLWLLIHMWDYILQPTVFFRKDAFFDVGLVNETLRWSMDWDLWIRIGSCYRVAFMQEYLAYARVYSNNKTSTGGFKRFREIIKVMRNHGSKRYPIGYFIYGEDTLENAIKARFPKIYESLLRRILTRLRTVIEERRRKLANKFASTQDNV